MAKRVIDREANAQRGLKYLYWRYVRNFDRRLGRDAHRGLAAGERAVDAELLQNGILVKPTRELLSESGAKALDEVARNFEAAATKGETVTDDDGRRQRKKGYVAHLLADDVEADDPCVRLALDPKLLGVVSRYLGFKPLLFDMKGWLNTPSGKEREQSQLWHRDPEDIHLIKVFFYLVDVDEETGPFEFVPRSHGKGEFGRTRVPHADRKRVLDEEMEAVFPRDTWQSCTGGFGTMVVADTTGYHRGGHVEKGQRMLFTITYTSGHPVAREKRKVSLHGHPAEALNELQRFAFYPGGKTR